MTLLTVQNLSVSYGDTPILHHLNLHLETTEIVALVGANGAGKTTLLRALTGLIPAKGTITLDNQNLSTLPAHRRAKSGIAMVPEGRRLFAGLTVRQNLEMGVRARPETTGSNDDIDFVFTQFPELVRLQHRLAGLLSGGEQQMVAIGRALMARPRILLVDEMSLGLAPVIVERLAHVIRTVNATRQVAILLVEQDVGLALEIAHRAYVLETGHIVIEGPSQDLLGREEIQTAYLGFAASPLPSREGPGVGDAHRNLDTADQH